MATKFTGMVLALDLATTTGFAWGRPGDAPEFASIRFIKHGGPRALAYQSLRSWLDARWHMLALRPDLIVYESPNIQFMAGKTNIETVKLLVGLAEHLEEWALGRIELREATTSQVRCHFIGKNHKASIAKPMTVERCQQLGWNVSNTDEADACALWDYQCCWLRPDVATKTTALFQQRNA